MGVLVRVLTVHRCIDSYAEAPLRTKCSTGFGGSFSSH